MRFVLLGCRLSASRLATKLTRAVLEAARLLCANPCKPNLPPHLQLQGDTMTFKDPLARLKHTSRFKVRARGRSTCTCGLRKQDTIVFLGYI